MQIQDNSFFFESLFRHASLAILAVNEKGEIVVINPFAVKLFGYDNEDEIIGKHLDLLIPQRYRSRHKQHHVSYMNHPVTRPMGAGMDLFALKKNGEEFPVEISLAHHIIDEKTYVLTFINDITLRKNIENELLKLNSELEEKVKQRTISLEETVQQLNEQIKETEQKDKELRASLAKEKELNELKSRFVSVASHEFRTPLSTVLSSIYLLQKYTETEDQPKREKHIQRIISSVNLLTEILNDFLNVGKIEEGKIEVRLSEFDIRANLEETIKELETNCKKGQHINYQHTGNSVVYLDPKMLKHISINLITNAIKFSPEDTEISVKSMVSGNNIDISFKDSGIGISKEEQAHLFERFFRAANAVNIQGTGLGLHIVSKYVELMKGNISFTSEPGKGTEFIISFKNINPL